VNRRFGSAVLGAVALSLVLGACGGSSGSTTTAAADSKAKAPSGLMKAGQFTVCIDAEYPPLEYFQNGTSGDIVGFDADAARATGDLWGVKTVFQNTAFDGLMPALAAKRCDAVWSGLYLSPKRLEIADGVAYLATGPGLIVNSDSKGKIKAQSDLAGKTVAVQGGSANEQIIRDLSVKLKGEGKPEINVQAYPKVAETVAAVTNGKADALIETDVALPDMIKKSNGKLSEVKDFFPADTKFGAFVSKGGTLTQPLTDAVDSLRKNGKLAEIAKKYELAVEKLNVS